MKAIAINGSLRKNWNTDTIQVKDHSRYHLAGFEQFRHETVFPEDCRKAYELGVKLCAAKGKI